MVQLVPSRNRELAQQPFISLIPTVVWVNTNLPQLIYPKVLFTNHRMEDNLEIHLKEVHMEEIHLEDHHSIHMLDHLDG
jgi:hypothetical protein